MSNVLPSDRFSIDPGDPIQNWITILSYLKDIIITNAALRLGIPKTIASLNPDIAVRSRTDSQPVSDPVVVWYVDQMNKKFTFLANIDKVTHKKDINSFYRKLMGINGMPINKILETIIGYIDDLYNAVI